MTMMTDDDKAILLYLLFIRQMGGIADCLRHLQSQRQGVIYSKEEQAGWIAHMKTELADTVQLVQRTGLIFGLHFDELVVLGSARDAEKRKEYLERHPGAEWI